ncbi:hypothetical protein BGY98DRAFT_48501 [Russula aff. rugulosa BPL654]|nr:hypothetical protein BGY98DRAFT_48501 [Russula aff. rugulosa BPL654]
MLVICSILMRRKVQRGERYKVTLILGTWCCSVGSGSADHASIMFGPTGNYCNRSIDPLDALPSPVLFHHPKRSRHQMTFSTAATLILFFFFSSHAVAQVVAPPCTNDTTWGWSYNSLGQNPCLIVAYMMSTCNGGTFTVEALTPGQNYIGPSGQDDSNLCKCSTIVYSLISACDACQGSNWISWSQFVTNCSKTEPAGAYPNPIPGGTRLPQWTLIDITNQNDWNATQSYLLGDGTEIGPGTLLGPGGTPISSSTGPTGTSTSSTSSSSTPVPASGHSSNTGAIAGGVVGGLAAIIVAIASMFFCRRGRHSQTPAPTSIDERPSGFNSLMDQVPRSMSGPGTIASSMPDTDPSMLRFYDPNDPTTFPNFQAPSPPPVYPRNSMESPSGPPPFSGKSPYIVNPAPNSQGQAPGYGGLPEP